MVPNLSKNRNVVILTILLFFLLIIGSIFFYQEPIRNFEETRDMMSTFVTISVYSNNEADAKAAINAAFERINEIVAVMSTFNESSDAYKLNLYGNITNPSTELIDVIQTSKLFTTLTNGSFDITVQPLLDLWQYHPDAEKQFWELNVTTQQEKINEIMSLIGSDKIEITSSPSSIRFQTEGMKITLGGIAKGYAVDEGLKVLETRGISYALINAGGDLATIDSKPDAPWTIALQNPENKSDYITRFEVSGRAVTTSGNYERWFNSSAKVGHIFDPKTGFSVISCWSVTIIANNCTWADALATGVFVMGPQKGMQLIEALDNVEGLIIDSEGQIHRSSGLSQFEY